MRAASDALRVAIVTPQEVVARGLVAMLADYPDRLVVATLASARSQAKGIDVIIYDTLGLFNTDDSELRHLVQDTKAVVLLLSRDTRPDLRARAMGLGAVTWVPMNIRAADLVDAVEITAARRATPPPDNMEPHPAGLTARQVEVLSLIGQGMSNDAISAALFISPNTLKSYIRDAYKRIGVSTRSQAVIWAISAGLAKEPGPGLAPPRGTTL